jgi:hypothetical protein
MDLHVTSWSQRNQLTIKLMEVTSHLTQVILAVTVVYLCGLALRVA